MGTVYVIGAGASKEIWDLPVLGKFFKDDEVKSLLRERHTLRRYIRLRFGDPSRVNLEHLLADLDNQLLGLGLMWHGTHSKHNCEALSARTELLTLLKDRFEKVDPQIDSTYGHVIKTPLGQDDRIITFNYDLGIEAFLNQPVNTGFTTDDILGGLSLANVNYNLDSGSVRGADLPLIKLHGSIDYWTCCNPECPHGFRIFHRRYHDEKGFCSLCGASAECVIVPPSSTKSFSKYPRLALLWRVAEQSLYKCDRLTFWGYSCPPSDHHFAWLLRNSFSAKRTDKEFSITIVDRCARRVAKHLRLILGFPLKRISIYGDQYEYAKQRGISTIPS